jgi:hypothetical protein
MFVSGKLLGSPCHQLEGSNQATFCQLYLETILALRAGISKRGFGSYSKLFLAGGLSFQGRFGLERAPRPGANSTQSYTQPCDFALLDVYYDRR